MASPLQVAKFAEFAKFTKFAKSRRRLVLQSRAVWRAGMRQVAPDGISPQRRSLIVHNLPFGMPDSARPAIDLLIRSTA